ncbi:hypothetical protein [Rhodoferax sp.]|uniref:hypothetical protein n=1 Tax=Rhodoferax sp. TaxID=50421 RepID=UPI0025F75F60|nr:hypothetical protein [Rhodoferax sp.]MCM2341670.1 hypothetical protein [Rhodoferax sp.]
MQNTPINYHHVACAHCTDMDKPNFVRAQPDLIGRVQGDGQDTASVRSSTTFLAKASVPFEGAVAGVATATVFESKGVWDDGGLVIRCTLRNDASAYQPHAVVIADGVDFHIAGEEESAAMLSAIQQACRLAANRRQVD